MTSLMVQNVMESVRSLLITITPSQISARRSLANILQVIFEGISEHICHVLWCLSQGV